MRLQKSMGGATMTDLRVTRMTNLSSIMAID